MERLRERWYVHCVSKTNHKKYQHYNYEFGV